MPCPSRTRRRALLLLPLLLAAAALMAQRALAQTAADDATALQNFASSSGFSTDFDSWAYGGSDPCNPGARACLACLPPLCVRVCVHSDVL